MTTTTDAATQVKNVRAIRAEGNLFNDIDRYLRSNFGFFLTGGSIVTLEDGTVQHFLSIDTGCAATTGNMGENIRRKFGMKNLYLGGIKV